MDHKSLTKDNESNNALTIKTPKDLPPINRNEDSLTKSCQKVLTRTQEPEIGNNLDEYQFDQVVNNLKEELETLKSNVNKKIEEELYDSSKVSIKSPQCTLTKHREPMFANTQRELYWNTMGGNELRRGALSAKVQSPCSIRSGDYSRVGDNVSETITENGILRRQLDQLRSNERIITRVTLLSNA